MSLTEETRTTFCNVQKRSCQVAKVVRASFLAGASDSAAGALIQIRFIKIPGPKCGSPQMLPSAMIAIWRCRNDGPEIHLPERAVVDA